MGDRLSAATLWWGVFAVFAFLTGLAVTGVIVMDGFAAGVFATLAFLFFLCAGAGVYLAVAAHRGSGPFREPPLPTAGPEPPVVEPSVAHLSYLLNKMRTRGGSIPVPPDTSQRSTITPSLRPDDEE